MTKVLKRYLDERETVMYGTGRSFGALVVECCGSLELESLKSAFQHLFARYAVLRSRITRDNFEIIMSASEDAHPRVIVRKGDKDSALHEAITYWDDGSGFVVKPLIIYNDNVSYVLFGMDHTIIDASSAFFYYSELWQIYTDIVRGNEIERPGPQSLPLAPSDVVGNYRDKTEPLVDTETNYSRVLPGESELQEHRKVCRRLTLDYNSTLHLSRSAKEFGVGVNSLIGGTMATVLRDVYPGDGELKIRFHILIDIRKNPERVLQPHETTYAVSPHLIVVKVENDDDGIAVAQKLKNKISEARKTMNSPLALDTHVDINLRGVGELRMEHPDDLKFTDIFPFLNKQRFSNTNYSAKERDEIERERKSKTLNNRATIGFDIWTINGILSTPINVTPWKELNAEALIDTFTERLHRIRES